MLMGFPIALHKRISSNSALEIQVRQTVQGFLARWVESDDNFIHGNGFDKIAIVAIPNGSAGIFPNGGGFIAELGIVIAELQANVNIFGFFPRASR